MPPTWPFYPTAGISLVTKDEMLRRAVECRVAKAALQPFARLVFQEIAETWERLARQQEYLGLCDAAVARAALEPATDTDNSP